MKSTGVFHFQSKTFFAVLEFGWRRISFRDNRCWFLPNRSRSRGPRAADEPASKAVDAGIKDLLKVGDILQLATTSNQCFTHLAVLHFLKFAQFVGRPYADVGRRDARQAHQTGIIPVPRRYGVVNTRLDDSLEPLDVGRI